METELPSWLNTEFLETVLREGDETRQVKVITFTAKLALPPGNNFTSHMFRVKVEYTVDAGPPEDISLIVKAPVTKGLMSEMGSKVDMFAAEPQVYQELLPKLREKIGCNFGPKSFPCPIRGMVLKDLKTEGFLLCDRLKQLDFSHCQIALTSLAKFHAATVACFHEDPEFIKTLGKERIYSDSSSLLDDFKLWLSTAVRNVTALIKENKGCEKTANYFSRKADTLMESLIEILKPREGALNVLNHGDFWMSNMLFKYDERDNLVDVKFIDFQVVRYGSPVLDIVYFIYTSANEEARSRQNELFNFYLQTFNSSLQTLRCEERLSLSQFDEEIKKCKDWAAVAICNVLPIVLCDPENVQNMEEFTETDLKDAQSFDKYQVVYKSKRLREELPKVVKHFQSQFFR